MYTKILQRDNQLVLKKPSDIEKSRFHVNFNKDSNIQKVILSDYDFELVWLISHNLGKKSLVLESSNSTDIFVKINICRRMSQKGDNANESYFDFDLKTLCPDDLSKFPVKTDLELSYDDFMQISFEIYCANKNLHSGMDEIAKSYGSLLENKNSSDVTLVVGDVKFSAHKCILSARSPVFCAMLECDMVEKSKGTVEINDIQPDIIQLMLEFLYTGKFDKDNDENFINMVDWQRLMLAADKYSLSSLKSVCARNLTRSLNIDNVIDIYILSDLVKEAQLKKISTGFIIHNKRRIVSSKNFKENIGMLKSNAELAVELIQELFENKYA